MAAASPVAQRAKKAAIISAFTFGIGGWFYSGHWFYGLMFAGLQLLSLVLVFAVVGLFMFPILWIFGCFASYMMVKRDAMEKVLLRQADEAEIRNRLAGGGA
jgi:hypothetical protein